MPEGRDIYLSIGLLWTLACQIVCDTGYCWLCFKSFPAVGVSPVLVTYVFQGAIIRL